MTFPRTLALALVAAFIVGCAPANGQAPSTDREAQIIANLTFEYPQLEDLDIRIDSLQPTSTEGLDEGFLVIAGQTPQPILVTGDSQTLYLLGAPPVDISRSVEDIAAAAEVRDAAENAAAIERGIALAAAVEGLPVRGTPDAPVTIVEFSDFECPYCRLASGTIERVLEKHKTDVKLVYAHFPLSNHPWAEPAAIAATCAAQQSNDAFWSLHDTYFAEQQTITPTNVITKSEAVLGDSGIDLASWRTCATDTQSEAYQGVAAAVQSQLALGEEYGVTGTPGFFVNGRFVNGNQPLDVFEAAIQSALTDPQ
ncbi:MAG: DsbA family protein [Bacteroidota bacterium]